VTSLIEAIVKRPPRDRAMGQIRPPASHPSRRRRSRHRARHPAATKMLLIPCVMTLAFTYRPLPISSNSAQRTAVLVHPCDNDPTDLVEAQAAPSPCGKMLGCAGCNCGLSKEVKRNDDVAMSIATDEDTAAVAQAAAAAAATAAERFAVKGGNSGDVHGASGIEPVIKATLDACGDCQPVRDQLEQAATGAAARTNANAARVADAIIVTAKVLGAKGRFVRQHPLTGEALYGTMYDFTRSDCKWSPEEAK
jgi:hypothetical protein